DDVALDHVALAVAELDRHAARIPDHGVTHSMSRLRAPVLVAHHDRQEPEPDKAQDDKRGSGYGRLHQCTKAPGGSTDSIGKRSASAVSASRVSGCVAMRSKTTVRIPVRTHGFPSPS